MTQWLLSRLEQKRSEPQFEKALTDREEIKVRQVFTANLSADSPVESAGLAGEPAAPPESVEIADRDLRRRVARADRELGEGLASSLVRARESRLEGEVSDAVNNGALRQARLEVMALVAVDDNLKGDLESRAADLIEEWARDYADEIEKLPDRERNDLKALITPEGEPRLVESSLAAKRVTRRKEKSEQSWDKHLYVDENGQYFAKLNGWEQAVLEEELARPKVVAWFRNKLGVDRWRLAVPYVKGRDTHLMYPDLIVFRQSGHGLVADILDPHGLHLADAVAKAHGLAKYAEDHADSPLLGRVEAIAEIDGTMRRLNLSDSANRDEIMGCDSSVEVRAVMAGIKLANEHHKPDIPLEHQPPEQPRDSGDPPVKKSALF